MRTIGLGTFKATSTMHANVQRVLETGRLSYGPFCRQFEAEFARLHDCRYAILANSGTDALRIGLDALKQLHHWERGDQIIVPSITFVATINVILQLGLRPIMVDVDPVYYHLDPDLVERAITSRTRAIFPVHLFGQPCDMAELLPIAQAYDLLVLEDSCEAMFVGQGGRSVGSFGAVAGFSTYVAHLVTTGVGGIITTNDAAVAAKARSLVNHGRDGIYISIDDDAQVSQEIISKRFSFESIGYSCRITELEAAIGLPQLQEPAVVSMLQRRRANANLLSTLLSRYNWLQLPTVRPNAEHAWMMYPLALRPDSPYAKAELVLHLEKNGIETRDLMPILGQPVYQRMFWGEYPVARWLATHGFYIGCHQDLTPDDMAYVGRCFAEFVEV